MSIYPPTGTLEIKNATLKIPVIDLQYTSNTAKIEANSNVVTEFPRSKKLIKYPRVAMTSASQTVSGYEGHFVSQNTGSKNGTSNRQAWALFDNVLRDKSGHAGPHFLDSTGGYDSNGDYTRGDSLGGVSGDWAYIRLPDKIQLQSVDLWTRYDNIRNPIDATVLGSLNGTNWNVLGSWKNATFTAGESSSFTINSIQYYDYIGFVFEKIEANSSGTYVNIHEIELFGTPEYDPEAHGTDVVVKSLPNVPNTDWLEVYYDAKDLADGAVSTVNDLKPVGTAINGVANGNLSVLDGAFTFDGTSDIRSTVSTFTGDQPHTMSVWVNISKLHTGADGYICILAPSTGETVDKVSSIRYQNDGFNLQSWGNDIQMYNLGIQKDRWYHLVAVYDGGGVTTSSKRLYIDNVQNLQISTDGTTSNTISFTNTTLSLGSRVDGSGAHLKGSIANFRLFNRALTSDEIYQLCAYQKEYFRHGDLSMTLKAGRLGIGTSEPRAALDVRGNIIGGCPAAFSVAYNPTSLSGNQTIIWNLIYHNVGGGYNSSNGLFTAPVSGYYHFTVWGMTSGTASGTIEFQFMKNGSTVQQRPYGHAGGNYGNATGSIIEYLNIGDTMSIFLTNGTTMYATSTQSYNGFSGFYLSS